MKKMSVGIFLLLVVIMLTACKTKIPDVETAARYSEDELQQLASKTSEKELIDSWGEPQVVNNRSLWTVPLEGATEYLVAYIENGEVVSINRSQYLYVTVIKEGYCVYGWKNYSNNSTDLAAMPSQDVFGNPIEYEVGDQIIFQFDGMIMETYPAQINQPYSAMLMGHLDDDAVSTLVEGCEFLK